MKHRRLCLWPALLLSLALLCGCSSGGKEEIPDPPPTPVVPTPDPEPEPEPITPEINISTDIPEGGLTCSCDQATQSITFTTNTKWTLTVNPGKDWCTPSATQGEAGEATVTFTITANDRTEERKATVSIKAETVTRSFTIKQEGKPEEEPEDPGQDNPGNENPGTGNPNGTIGNMNWG